MPRDLHRKPFNEGTLAKLELFRGHITAWLSVFVKSERVTKKKIRVFDFFCGPGADSAGKKGSPLLILETLQGMGQSIRKMGYEVEVYLNDADPAKIEALKQTLIERSLMAGPYQLHISCQKFLDAFNALRPHMVDAANLLLLDQNGVRFFTADIFHQIRTLPFTDVLVFMSASYVLRFKDEPEINKYLEAEKI